MIYLISVNLLSFLIGALDKWKAVHHRWRIPESVLLTFSLLGGCFGMLLSMYFCHHKTKKLKFKLVYVFCVIWCFLIYYMLEF